MSIFDKIVDGKVYLLLSDTYNKFYIGSTTVSLEERLKRHVESYDEWLKSNFTSPYLSSFEILKYPDYRMELIEECSQVSGWDLIKREQYHLIVNYKDIVNIIIPGKDVNKKLTNTSDIYICSCGYKMKNHYNIRKKHSLSPPHRQNIRALHLSIVLPEKNPVEIVYGGITLDIT